MKELYLFLFASSSTSPPLPIAARLIAALQPCLFYLSTLSHLLQKQFVAIDHQGLTFGSIKMVELQDLLAVFTALIGVIVTILVCAAAGILFIPRKWFGSGPVSTVGSKMQAHNSSDDLDLPAMPKLEKIEDISEATLISTVDYKNVREPVFIRDKSHVSTKSNVTQEKFELAHERCGILSNISPRVEFTEKDVEFCLTAEPKYKEDSEEEIMLISTFGYKSAKGSMIVEAGRTEELSELGGKEEKKEKVEVEFSSPAKGKGKDESEQRTMLISTLDDEHIREPAFLDYTIKDDSSEISRSKDMEKKAELELAEQVNLMEADVEFRSSAAEKCREEIGEKSMRISIIDDRNVKVPVFPEATIREELCDIGGRGNMAEKLDLSQVLERTETDAESCSPADENRREEREERTDGNSKAVCRAEEIHREESEEMADEEFQADCRAEEKCKEDSDETLVEDYQAGQLLGEESQANVGLCTMAGMTRTEERDEKTENGFNIIVDETPGNTTADTKRGEESEERKESSSIAVVHDIPGTDLLGHEADYVVSYSDDWVGVQTSQLERNFVAAQSYVKKVASDPTFKFSNDVQLQFEALEKQATVGPCKTPAPSPYRFSARATWQAWQKLGPDISMEDAMQQYVLLLRMVRPNWDEDIIEGNKEIGKAEEVGGRSPEKATLSPAYNLLHGSDGAQGHGTLEETHRHARTGNAGVTILENYFSNEQNESVRRGDTM